MSGRKGEFMPIYTDKKTKRLYIQFDFLGQTHKKRLPKKTTKSEAVKLETKLKNKLFFEANSVEAKRQIKFEDFLVEYFLPFAEANHRKASFDRQVIICKLALPFFKGNDLRQIKPADIEKFKQLRVTTETQHKTVRKPATVLRELSIISKVFSLAVKNDFLEFNPCSRVEKPKFDNIQNRILQMEDEAKFLAEFQSDWAKDICILVLNTGLRQNDALGLSKFNVDWSSNVIRLIQGKTKRVVEIPMNNTVKALLQARRHNGSDLFFPSPKNGLQGTSIKKAVIGACARAKIEPITIRDLRRTFGTRLGENNVNTTTIAKLLGHGDLRSIHRYQRGTEIMREAVGLLENPAKILPLARKSENQKAVSY
jgi:integrase